MKLPLATSRELRHALVKLLRIRKWQFGLVVLLQVVASVAAVAIPWLLGRIIDGLTEGADETWVRHRVITAFIAVAIAGVMT